MKKGKFTKIKKAALVGVLSLVSVFTFVLGARLSDFGMETGGKNPNKGTTITQTGTTTNSSVSGGTVLYETGDATLPTAQKTNAYTAVTVINGGLDVALDSGFPTLSVVGNLYVEDDFTVVGVSSATNTLTVNGDIVVGGNFDLKNCTLKLTENSRIYVGGNLISATSTKIETAEFMGFAEVDTDTHTGDAERAIGEKTLTLVGVEVNDVATVGVHSNATAALTLVGEATGNNYVLYADYPFTYYDKNQTLIETPSSFGLPQHYRVRYHSGGGSYYAGLRYNNGVTAEPSNGESLTLPTAGGWEWKESADGEVLSTLPLSRLGEGISLYANIVPKDVIINYELGYTPTQTTNDDPAAIVEEFSQTSTHTEGGEITLKTPWRMGYKFLGWRVVTGNENNGALLEQAVGEEGVTCTLDSAWVTTAGDMHTLTLTAEWEAKKYPIKFTVGQAPDNSDFSTIRLKVKETEGWLTIEQFKTNYASIVYDHDEQNHVFQFNIYAEYGSNFNDYLAALGIECFDVKFEGSAYTSLWQETQRNIALSAETGSFVYGENGFFGHDLPNGYTSLENFESVMASSYIPMFKVKWASVDRSITFSNTDWESVFSVWISQKDEMGSWLSYAQYTPINNVIGGIPSGAKVQFRLPATASSVLASFGLWTLTANGEPIEVKEAIYNADDGYYCYDFTMPILNVEANFASTPKDTIINLKTSPVTEETLTVNGRVRQGFWTNQLFDNLQPLLAKTGAEKSGYGVFIDGESVRESNIGYCNNEERELCYFYEWSYAREIWITTGDANQDYGTIEEGNGTWNQYVGRAQANRAIYFEDCHLWATSYYTEYAKESLKSTTQFTEGWNRTSVLPKFLNAWFGGESSYNNFTIYFSGNNNIIGAIGQTSTVSTQNIRKANTSGNAKVQLGCHFGAGYPDFIGLDFYPYASEDYKDNFEWLNYGQSRDTDYLSACNLYLPHKKVSGASLGLNIGYANLLYASGSTTVSGGLLVIESNLNTNLRFTINVGATVIVKGDVEVGKVSSYESIINGTLVVLGKSMPFSKLIVRGNGLIVANAIHADSITQSSGLIVTNYIASHSATSEINPNGDYDLLTTTVPSATGYSNSFTGGQTYLLGYYTLTEAGKIDTSASLTDEGNPLAGIAEIFTAETLGIDVTSADVAALVAEYLNDNVLNDGGIYDQCKENYRENECAFFGSSTNTVHTVTVSADADIHCAGRMTLFYSLNVTGGTIEAAVLSSKQDLTISGGTITAGEIGNSASVLFGDAGQKRYAKTNITGGAFYGVTKLGAVTPSTAYASSVENHSYVTVSDDAVINTQNGGNIPIDRDIYINYPANVERESVYNGLTAANKANYAFTMPDDMPVYIRISCTGNPNDFAALAWTSTSGAFEAASYIADPTQPYRWSLAEGESKLVHGYANSLLQGEGMTDEEKSLADKDYLRLYLYIVIPREFTIYQQGEVISSFTINGEAYTDLTDGYNVFTLNPTDSLVFTLNRVMTNKVVFWYKDDVGAYCNLLTDGVLSDDGTTVSFAMPNLSNAELYICDEMPLFLDEYDIEIHAEGFDYEIDGVQSANFFDYQGSLLISSNLGASTSTGHYVSFVEGFKNYDLIKEDENGNTVDENGYPIYEIVHDENRRITLKDVYAKGTSNRALTLAKGVYAAVGIEGTFNAARFSIDAAHLHLYGKNGNRTDKFAWKVNICVLDSPYLEDICFTDLTMGGGNYSLIAANKSGKTLVFQNCSISGGSWFNGTGNNYMNFTFIGCNVTWSGAFLHRPGNITFRNSVYRYTANGSDGAQMALGYGRKGHIVLDNSKVYGYEGIGNSTAGLTYQANGNQSGNISSLTLKNNSEFIDAANYRIDGPTKVESGSKLYIGVNNTGDNARGRFRSRSILVSGEGSELRAGYVVSSGYYVDANNVSSGGKITVEDGGKIIATELIGGDGGTINVNGGELQAKYIGTVGKYIKNVQISTPTDVYVDYAKASLKSTIEITGGRVTLLEDGYIGGYNSVVTIAGGTVNAELGSIEGKTITLSGANLKLRAKRIDAPNGSISVLGTTAYNFDNAYPNQPDRKHPFVAVLVDERLSAQEITVDNGALVYAKSAFVAADEGNNSFFTVTVNSALYTSTYGTLGEGNHDGAYNYIPNDESGNQTIWGIQAITVTYEVFGEHFEGFTIPLGSDRDFLETNDNPSYYNFGENGGSITLNALVHPYYEFLGWFYEDGTERTSINTNQIPNSYTRTLYAKWQPKTVTFQIVLSADLLDDDSVDPPVVGADILETEVQNHQGTFAADNTSFTWSETLVIPYWESINTEERYMNSKYQLYSYQITGAQVLYGDESMEMGDTLRVTREMLTAYEDLVAANGGNREGVALTIALTQKARTVHTLRFSVNKVDGKPADAAFTSSNENIVGGVFTLRADVGYKLGQVAYCDVAMGEDALKATGYTFKGWTNDPSGTDYVTNEQLKERLVDGSLSNAWYAYWEVNKYYIAFDVMPDANYPYDITIDGKYYWAVDGSGILPNESGFNGQSFTVSGGVASGEHVAVLEIAYDKRLDGNIDILPAAYRDGSVFDYWCYHDEAGNHHASIVGEDLFNFTSGLEKELFEKNGSPDSPAFKLYAHYRAVKVEYELDGGVWTDDGEDVREYVAHVEEEGICPLAAYDRTDSGFAFVSTTAEEYTANGDFLEKDYRNTLKKTGYTFLGWFTSPDGGEEVTHTLLYSDCVVYARWEANEYIVKLYSHDGGVVTSGATFVAKENGVWVNNANGAEGVEVRVTVGQPINNTTVANWPSRNDWGTRGEDNDVEPRQLWGFTSQAIDPQLPGTAAYKQYHEECQALYNLGQLFVKNESDFGGKVFSLTAANHEDAPNGYAISLYAVYREYALVFMQYYLDEAGEEVKVMCKTIPYGEMQESTLAAPSINPPKENYAHIDWFVNTTEINELKRYSVADMLDSAKLSAYKAEAERLGTYDIVVYAICVAHEEIAPAGELIADGEAHLANEINAQRVKEFVLPMNMLADELNYAVTGFSGLNLLSQAGIEENRYNFTTANGSAALILTVIRDGEEKGSYALQSAGKLTDYDVQGGDLLRLTLEHSFVMSDDVAFDGDIKFTFGDIDGDKQYVLLSGVKITLTPSTYTLQFSANLPDLAQSTDSGSFTEGDALERKGDLKENNPFLGVKLPSLVGYEAEGDEVTQIWYSDAACSNILLRVQGEGLEFAATPRFEADGTLKLYTKWNLLQYLLTIDESMTDWSVTPEGATQPLSVGSHAIDFGTTLRFTGVDNPEFVLLHQDSLHDQRLEIDVPATNGEYLWCMPNGNATVYINTVMELYLEEGSVAIVRGADTAVYYFQNRWVKWRGSYNILMDKYNNVDGSATSNTLTLNGDLDGVEINLGNLNVIGEDSLSLAAGAYVDPVDGATLSNGSNVTLNLHCALNGESLTTASVSQLANILVPENASLQIEGESGSKLTLAPAVNAAAIGQREGGDGSAITVRNCTLAVEQEGDYVGVWFGGANTSTLTLENVVVEQVEPDNYSLNRYATYADNVLLKNVAFGTEETPISEPIYAKSRLSVNGGEIYVKVWVPLGYNDISAIGTQGGRTEIASAKVKVTYGSNGQTNRLFTGRLLLEDQAAEVVINNTCLMEMGYGDLTISQGVAEQNGRSYAFSGKYLLLAEKATESAYDLTVNGGSAKDITVLASWGNGSFAFHNLTVNADTTLRLLLAETYGNVTLDVQNTLTVAEEKTLTVWADASGIVRLANDAMLNANGSYVQEYGALISAGDIGGKSIGITLNNVTATAASLYAEYLTLNGCSVTCENGKVGSYGKSTGATTVTLSGATTIFADVIGALGEKRTTFTKLLIEGDGVCVTGTLARDVYRVTYTLQSGYIYDERTNWVLRTEEVFNGEAVAEPSGSALTYAPTVSGDKTNRFVTWYIPTQSGKIALFEELEQNYQDKFISFQAGLLPTNILYAVEDEEGIPTVSVLAFYSISGTVALETEYKFFVEDFIDGTTNLQVASNRGWSALFTIESVREDGEDYAVTFSSGLPVGTNLMLVWVDRAADKPTYYYYTVTEETGSTIKFSQFIALGSTDTLRLGASANERERFILTIDYAGASVTAETNRVEFGYQPVGGVVETLCAANVTVAPVAESVRLEVNQTEVTVTLPDNDEYENKTYAIVVEAEQDFRYDVTPTLTNVEGSTVTGKLLGGNRVLFIVDADAVKQSTYAFTLTGWEENYVLSWEFVLLDDSTQVNAWKSFPAVETAIS